MISKKACREHAAPGVAMSANSGIFCAQQVKYIVQTMVKIIDRQRVLVLYIYRREDAAKGDFRPLWTMFHCKDGYITLARQPDGRTKWRAASFENLERDYFFVGCYAYYSAEDQERLHRYFHAKNATGFSPLVCAQSKLLEQRLAVRQKTRERKIRNRMKGLPALPAGLKEWAHRTIMPAYFFYDYHRNAKSVTGICSSCQCEITVSKAKHNLMIRCPHCGREIKAKSRGRRGRLFDRDTCQVVQRTGPDEVVARIIKVWYSYKGDAPKETYCENARIYARLDNNGAVQTESYYYSYNASGWKKGIRPVYSQYCYNYEADVCGHVYCGNLPGALKGTPWQYCPVEKFYNQDHVRMEMSPFLAAYLKHPRLEHLIKTGFCALACDLTYRNINASRLDETQNRTHRILRVAAEDVEFLRELDVNASTLAVFQKYCEIHLKHRQELLRWQLESKVEQDILPILGHMTAHKFMRYMDNQYAFLRYRKNRYHTLRYRNMQSLVSEYRDYLDMCVKQEYNMKNSFILYPKDLQKSHDRVAHRIKLKADAQMRRDFQAAYDRIMDSLDFEFEGLKIVYPHTPEDIIQEGNALHHCVGSYVDRVAKRECIIVFLRRCEEVEKPYYTVEIRGQKAVQVSGMRNEGATPEVKRFIAQWEREVLQSPAHRAA